MTLPRRRLAWIAAALTACLLGGVAFAGWRLVQARAEASAGLPARPDLRALASELTERITQAENEVRSGWKPRVALAELSRLYHANGFLGEARQTYQHLHALEPDNPRWPHLLANILSGYGQLDEALPLLQRTVDLAPAYVPARLRLADALQKNNQPAEAARLYDAVLAGEPNNPYALLGLARGHVAADRWSAARDRLRQIPENKRKLTAAWALLTTVEEKLGDTAAAAEANSAENTNSRYREMPDPWLDELMADCYDVYRLRVAAAVAGLSGEFTEARQLLERAVSLAPDDATARRNLAQVLIEIGELPAARSHLERAVQLAPAEPDGWNTLVTLLNKIGDNAAAEQAITTGLRNCPDSPTLHQERARRLAAAGNLQGAMGAFQVSRRLRPQEVSAYVEIARIHFRLGQLEEGVTELDRALTIDPMNPVALVILARYAIESADQANAHALLQRIRRQPKVAAHDVEMVTREFETKFGRRP